MEIDLQKLNSEYCAIEKMDRIVRSTGHIEETELVGVRVREVRRREILVALIKWIIVADNLEETNLRMPNGTLSDVASAVYHALYESPQQWEEKHAQEIS